MICRIADPNPTLSQVLTDLHNQPGAAQSSFRTLTRAQLVAAARSRGVPLVEGRVDRKYLGDLYFAARDIALDGLGEP